MKFLCTKVKPSWLTSPQNRERVNALGLTVNAPFIGIEVKNDIANEEKKAIHAALDKLFGENKKAFPVRLIEL